MPHSRTNHLLLVAGAARSGSTALAEALFEHPKIAEPKQKEPHYLAAPALSPDHAGVHGDTFDRRRVRREADYLSQLRASHDQIAIDASMSTLPFASVALPRASSLATEVQVLVVLRHPVHRMRSNFNYMSSRGREPLPYETALNAELDGVRRHWPFIYSYAGLSDYGRQLRELFECVDRDDTRVEIYEDHETDFQSLAVGTADFLGIDSKLVGSVASARNASVGSSRWGTASRVWEATAERVPATLRSDWLLAAGRRVRRSMLQAGKPSTSAPMLPQEREILDRQIAEVGAVLGVDLSRLWVGL